MAEITSSFIQSEINEDLKNGKYTEGVHTRFPPEPNGYLHVGHAKSICLNFGLAQQYDGKCNLRFDDTNPVKEDTEYVDSIQADVKWLGFSWDDRMFYASDYFGKLYDFAVELIKLCSNFWCFIFLYLAYKDAVVHHFLTVMKQSAISLIPNIKSLHL